MEQDASPYSFFRAFRTHWFAAMSGAPGVLFAIVAVFVSSTAQRIGLGVTALICFFIAAYIVWRFERLNVLDLTKRLLTPVPDLQVEVKRLPQTIMQPESAAVMCLPEGFYIFLDDVRFTNKGNADLLLEVFLHIFLGDAEKPPYLVPNLFKSDDALPQDIRVGHHNLVRGRLIFSLPKSLAQMFVTPFAMAARKEPLEFLNAQKKALIVIERLSDHKRQIPLDYPIEVNFRDGSFENNS